MDENILEEAYRASFHYGGLKKFAERNEIDYNYLRKELSLWKKRKNPSNKYILNSAVITGPGIYEYYHIDIDEVKKWLMKNNWESTIGYEESAKALSLLTGSEIPCNRKQVKMISGDEALVFRLTKRVEVPEMKGEVGMQHILENYEIGILRKVK